MFQRTKPVKMKKLITISFLIGVLVATSSCEKAETPAPTPVDYSYLINGRWYEIHRIYTVEGASGFRQADTTATAKGQEYVNFSNGIATYFSASKPSEEKLYEFTGGNKLKISYPGQSGNEETYTLTFGSQKMTAVMRRTTSNGLEDFNEKTTIEYVR